MGASVPDARLDSLNEVVDGQLDVVTRLIAEGQLREGLSRLSKTATGFNGFDFHQKERWHSQRAQCSWHLGDGDGLRGFSMRLRTRP